MNELPESSTGVVDVDAFRGQADNANERGRDGNSREQRGRRGNGLHVAQLKGQPLLSSGHGLPRENVDHLFPHLIFQEKPNSRLV